MKNFDPAALVQTWPTPAQPRPIVVFGAGSIVADAHFPAYRKAGFPIAGIYDPNQDKAEHLARTWGVGIYRTMEEAASVEDAIFDLATPPARHAEVLAALPDARAVLIQKPMGADLSEADQILDLCRRKRLVAAVNFQLRFAPMALALKDAIAKGWLGELVDFDAWLALDTPWHLWRFLLELPRVEVALHSIHYLDLIRQLLGEPKGIHAKTLGYPNQPIAQTRTSAILDYGDRVRCALTINHDHKFGRRHQACEFRIGGTKGAAFLQLGVNLDYPRGERDILEIYPAGGQAWVPVPLHGSWFPEAFAGRMANLQRFVSGEDQELIGSVEDAWHTMALVEAAYRSKRFASDAPALQTRRAAMNEPTAAGPPKIKLPNEIKIEAPVTHITDLRVFDLRFPTSQSLDGSDAMNPDPDYSAAYVLLTTDRKGLSGHGLTFTIGRGNEICCLAIQAMRRLIVGLDLEWIKHDPGRFWRHLTNDSQLRWIGPDKGAMHLATGALVNAVWDLWAKEAHKPVWRLVAEMTPEQILRIVDFRYLTDILTPDEALTLLKNAEVGKAERIATLAREGYPCYTTSAGWLGYSDEKLRRLCKEAIDLGFDHIKMKVGRDLEDDIRRLTLAREVIGPDRCLMIDANQVWEVDQAIEWVKALAFAKPFFIEEPTSPDDVAGHRKIRRAVAPIKVATGEMCQNRILFKQFIAEGAIDIVQIDACRMGGLNEALAVLLMAAKYGLPVWPHAGGVGLCEYVQHLSMIDYIAISGVKTGRVIEFVDHLHEHFIDPCVIRNAAYMPPVQPGFSIEMKAETLSSYRFGG